MVAPTKVHYQSESFDRITYDARHVLPFLIDLLSNYPRDINVGWYGGNLELLKMFAAAQRAIGYAGEILLDSGATSLGVVRAPFATSMERSGSCVRRYLCVRLLVACGRSRANRFQGNASSRRTFDGFPSYHLWLSRPVAEERIHRKLQMLCRVASF